MAAAIERQLTSCCDDAAADGRHAGGARPARLFAASRAASSSTSRTNPEALEVVFTAVDPAATRRSTRHTSQVAGDATSDER